MYKFWSVDDIALILEETYPDEERETVEALDPARRG